MRPHRSSEPPTPPSRKGSLEERDAKERSLQDSTILAWALGLIGVLGFVLGLNDIAGGWILVLLVASIAVSQISPPKR